MQLGKSTTDKETFHEKVNTMCDNMLISVYFLLLNEND